MSRTRAPRPPLTKDFIASAEPGPTRRYLWDGVTPGLAVLVQPGGAKSFIVQRGTRGRTVRRALGSFPEMTLAEARRLAEEPLATIRAGRNPNEERRAARAAADRERRDRVTCVELWRRYELEIVAVANRPSTAAQKRRMWQSRLAPVLAKVPVREVDGEHVRKIVHGVLRTGPDGRIVAGRAEAGNLYRFTKHLFRTAIRWKLLPPGSDPTQEVEAPKVPRRERLLTDAEMAALLTALADAARSGTPPSMIGAMHMVLLTGWRAGEVVGLRREHVDRERREARLPDTKTGFSARPLATDTLALLDAQPRVVGSPWYFPRPTDPKMPIAVSTLAHSFGRLCARAGVERASPHIVRHRIVTDVAGAAPNVRTGMAITGHKSVAAFMGYVHAERERAAEIADAVTGRIAALASAGGAGNVVTLPPRPARRASRRPARAAGRGGA